MSLRCIDLFSLPPFQCARLVAGKEGLGREIRWVHIAEAARDPENLLEWMKRRDLLVVVGGVLEGHPQRAEEFIRNAVDMELSGIVFYRSENLPPLNRSILALADQKTLPVIIMEDPSVSVAEITYDICHCLAREDLSQTIFQNIMVDILHGNMANSVDMFALRADFYQYNLRRPHQAVVIRFMEEDYIRLRQGEDRITRDVLFRHLGSLCQGELLKTFAKLLCVFTEDSFVALLPEGGQQARQAVDALASRLHAEYPELPFVAGTGNLYHHIEHFHQSIEEAQEIVRVMQRLGRLCQVGRYEDMQVYMMLYKLRKKNILMQIYEQNLLPLIQYDQANSNQLCETLKTYLAHNRSINETAEALFVHRNTLKYRLSKIEDLCGRDLSSADDCFVLQLACYIANIL